MLTVRISRKRKKKKKIWAMDKLKTLPNTLAQLHFSIKEKNKPASPHNNFRTVPNKKGQERRNCFKRLTSLGKELRIDSLECLLINHSTGTLLLKRGRERKAHISE